MTNKDKAKLINIRLNKKSINNKMRQLDLQERQCESAIQKVQRKALRSGKQCDHKIPPSFRKRQKEIENIFNRATRCPICGQPLASMKRKINNNYRELAAEEYFKRALSSARDLDRDSLKAFIDSMIK